MTRRKKIVNLLLGLFTSIVTGSFLIALNNLLIVYLEYIHPDRSYQWITIVCGIGVIGAFLGIMTLFFRRRKNQLSLYFLFAVAVSILFDLVCMAAIMNLLQPIILNFNFEDILMSDRGAYVGFYLGYVYLLVLVGLFIGIFCLMANRKIKYIQYISKRVRQMEQEGFGQTMEVQGNDELSELSTTINTMSVKLKEKIDQEKLLEKQKNELITNVSHDLRTPLTSVIGYVALLKQNKCEDKEQCMEYIKVVDRRLQGLNTMINELFEYTKMSSVDFTLACIPFEFIAVIRHMAEEYVILYQKVGLALEVQIEPEQCELMLDVEKMIRVLQNLFENARKYAVEGSTVRLHVYKEEQRLIVELQNETSQCSPADVEQLFERFYKGDTARSNGDSSGLGLSIVRRIVELHDGEINAYRNGNVISFQMKLKCD